MPSTFNRPPGCIWNLPPLPPGSEGLTLATSNSVGAGIAGRASATPGGFALGFWLTLSTTITGVGTCFCSSFNPSCLSTASESVTRSPELAIINPFNCNDHVRSKFHMPFSPVSSNTGFGPTDAPIMLRSPAANAAIVMLRHVY